MSQPDSKQRSSTSMTLLQRVRGRDPASWQRLVDLYRPLVAYWCQQWSINAADVEDIIQEVFAVVSEKVTSFHRDQPGDSFRGWLRGITLNKLREHSRKNRQEAIASGGTQAIHQMQNLSEKQEEQLLEEPVEQVSQLYLRAIDLVQGEFTPRTWKLFWRIVVDGQPAVAVAEEFDTTPAAARMAKSRVLRRLREEVGDVD